MDLERKNYMPENYGEVYEDEIDLKELFLVLWRNKVKILIIAFICMVLGFAAGKITEAKSKKATVVLEYNYPGIEEGKDPKGNSLGLTYNQFKNIFMIKDIFSKMPELEKTEISEEDVLNGIRIEPVLPEKLKEGEVFYPNKFAYSLKATKIKEISEEILKNFVEIQKDYLKRAYEVLALPIINYESFTSYEYEDMIFVLKNVITTLTTTLKSEILFNEDMVEIENILKELTNLKEIEIRNVEDIVKNYNLAKNSDNLLLKYTQQIEKLEREKEKVAGKISQLEFMVNSYKPENKDVVIMSGGTSEKVKTDEENYYTEFLRQLLAEKIKLSNINSEIKYIRQKMEKEINSNPLKQEEVNQKIKYITSEINEKVEKINSLIEKNYDKKYSEIVKVVEAVSTKSNSKTMLITLAGLILGFFFGACYVLVGNFIFEEKKKAKK